jgi:hypothetical protein
VLDPRSLIAAEFMIQGTSLPAESYPAMDVCRGRSKFRPLRRRKMRASSTDGSKGR